MCAAVAMLCLSLPTEANVLFSDIASAPNLYDATGGYVVAGASSPYGSSTPAFLFTALGSGQESVFEVDVAVSNYPGSLNTFSVSIWTDAAGVPGSQLPGAFWSLSTPATYGTCCTLESVKGITGLNLTGGDSYFLVIMALNQNDGSANVSDINAEDVIGGYADSANGGLTWQMYPGTTGLGTFDILAVPEPKSVLLTALGLALAAALLARRA